MPRLRTLLVGDDAQAWEDIGFTVVDSQVMLGRVAVELVGTADGRGILGWSLPGVDGHIDGLKSCRSPGDRAKPSRGDWHNNGVFSIEHVEISTDDVDRSVAAFAVAGMQEQRRTTSTDAPRTHRVRFFAGRTVLELVGPSPANNDHKGARFTGLGLVSDDLDRTAEVLGERLSAPTDSAHEGRRVATLRPEGNDISVPISILSPHPTAGIEHIAAEARESQGIEL